MMAKEEKEYTDGRNVLIWLLAFFLAFIVVDGIFVYLALDSFTGVVDQSDGK